MFCFSNFNFVPTGAMAAVLLATGLNPRDSAEFVATQQLKDFADPIGLGGILKGNMFEKIMVNRLKRIKLMNASDDASNIENMKLEHSLIPVAVTAFDLLTLQTKTLKKGCMARAARASACFPILFQPVSWSDDCDDDLEDVEEKNGFFSKLKKSLSFPKYLFIDGGVNDPHGLVGLGSLKPSEKKKRIVNLAVGPFARNGPLGPSEMPAGLDASAVLSVSVENAPRCGPDKMSNGPRATQAAMDAVNAVLDVPMYYGKEENHFILNIDATAFIPKE